MILKGSQRGNGADLAIHLMNGFDNERIEIAEISGAVAGDLRGAFAEFEAVATGTRAREYLYSLSINPSAQLTREQYFEAIAVIEKRLRLSDQPRAVVFHVKDRREHAHVVWSRIDVAKMRAVHLAHDHRKLMDLACELAHRFELDLAPGLKAWDEGRGHKKDKLEPTLAENAQAQETAVDPERRRVEITAAYEVSDSAEAFCAALEQKGYVLARGDKRGLVVVDRFRNVHSLTRYVKGHKAKQIKIRLAALKSEDLPSVNQAKESIPARTQAQHETEREVQQKQGREARKRDEERRHARDEELAGKQAARRLELRQAEQELLTRHQAERLALHAAQRTEARRLRFRVRSAVAALIRRTPGLRSVLSRIQRLRHLDPRARHALQNEALAGRHQRERKRIERHERFLARIERRERQSLKRAIRRGRRLKARVRFKRERQAKRLRAMQHRAKQDFFDAARDLGLWRQNEFRESELSRTFNEEVGFAAHEEDAGEEGETAAPDWDIGADHIKDGASAIPRARWQDDGRRR